MIYPEGDAMSFLLMKKILMKEFNENQEAWATFIKKCSDNAHLSRDDFETYKIQNSNFKEYIIDHEKSITITYPGYKTELKQDKYMSYDYRVNYRGVAISHPSIIVDLYNKAKQHQSAAKRLKKFLTVLAKEGTFINLQQFPDLLLLEFKPPTSDMLEIVNNVFRRLNKTYLVNSNIAWNFPFEDLVLLISWISLQEDINYPMSEGNLQGRMMPFYRYIEAVFSGIAKDQNKYSIDKVIERSLVHYQLDLWPTIDYSEITILKSLYKK